MWIFFFYFSVDKNNRQKPVYIYKMQKPGNSLMLSLFQSVLQLVCNGKWNLPRSNMDMQMIIIIVYQKIF